MKNFGSTNGLTILAEDQATPAKGMSVFLTSTYNTGWMPGDIKGAFLSDTNDTDLVGGTDADRSVNGNDLTVNGTITRSPVATGADLVAYSGFSASNYLEMPYNSDLDFGTGDFCIMGWVKTTDNFGCLFNRGTVGATADLIIDVAIGKLRILDAGIVSLENASGYDSGAWHFIAAYRSGSTLNLGVNGQIVGSTSNSTDFDNIGAVSRFGLRTDGTSGLNGSLALWRISATAPTDEQIAKIYNDELPLFQDNAQATIYGASDAVTALAHDPDTDLLHVGTSAGRSIFEGLRRVGNTTTSVSTAISASGGLIVEK